MIKINAPAPDFTEDAYMDERIKKGVAQNTELKAEGVEVISVSVDTAFVHKAWHDTSDTIRKIRYPMLADPARRVSSASETLIEDEGLALRSTFLIDPQGILKTAEMNDNSIGRSIDELIRKLQAAKFVAGHGGEVCPMN